MKQLRLITRSMGTVCEISVYAPYNMYADAEKAVTSVKDYLTDTDNRLSFFKKESEISKLNTSKRNTLVKLSPDTFNILKESKYYAEVTKGIFDITVGKSSERWRKTRDRKKYPNSENENKNIVTRSSSRDKCNSPFGDIYADYDGLILDEKTVSAKLTQASLAVDLGGIAKGYALDRIKKILLSHNIRKALINLGGSIYVIGNPEKIGLRNPFIPVNLSGANIPFASVISSGEAVITSGTYEQCFDNGMSHHIIDPVTGNPCLTDLVSATVISESGTAADVYATTLIILGLKESIVFSEKRNLSVILADKKGNIYVSKSIKHRFSLIKERTA